MNERPIEQRLPEYAAYADKMAKIQRETRVVKPPSDVQSASTRAILDRDPALDEEWRNRPLPKPQITTDQWGKASEEEKKRLIAARDLDPIEVSHFEATRRRPKNTIGQSEDSATTPFRRDAAIGAFTCSPPAKLTFKEREKLIKLSGYQKPPAPEEEPEENRKLKWDEKIFWALFHRSSPFRKGWKDEEVDGQ